MVIIFEEILATKNCPTAFHWVSIMLKIINEYIEEAPKMQFQDWLELTWKTKLISDPDYLDLIVGLDIDDEYVSILLLKL
jgi:hypothetical protein